MNGADAREPTNEGEGNGGIEPMTWQSNLPAICGLKADISKEQSADEWGSVVGRDKGNNNSCIGMYKS